jgi:hypothetical protein
MRTAVVVLFIVGIWIGGIIGYGYLKKSSDFRSQSEAVLKDVTSGKAAQVWSEAAPAFRATMLQEAFVDMADTLTKSLGEFRRIVEVLDADERNVPSGRMGFTKLNIAFANTTVEGELSFMHLHGKWRLLGFQIANPADKKIREQIAALKARPERLTAPTAVLEHAKSLIGKLADGKVMEVYKEAAPFFHEALSGEEFVGLLERRQSKRGKLGKSVDILSSAQNEAMDQANVVAKLDFGEESGAVALDFVKLEGQWFLAKLRFTDVPPN